MDREPKNMSDTKNDKSGFDAASCSRVIVWFSCGAASAVCADLALRRFKGKVPVELIYTDPGTYKLGRIGESPDNRRFLKDAEKWLSQEVKILKSEKFNDPMEVFEKRRYIVGVAGAPCTGELKKRLRESYQDVGDLHVFGFTSEERQRAERFKEHNPEIKLWTPLVERMISKPDCLAYIKEAGVKLPDAYEKGYRNANCVGCVKGQSGYWNKIRVDYPDVFDATAKLERDIGAAINKRYEGEKRIPVYLDELDPTAGNYSAEPDIECGLLCQIARQEDFCENSEEPQS